MPVYIGTKRALQNARGEGVGVPWAAGADLWKDFVRNTGSLSDPTDTHAATIYAPNAAGLYLPFAANVLTRTDLGLQTVPTRAQLQAAPQDISNASWTKTGTTVPGTSRIGPDGVTNALLLMESAGGTFHQTTISPFSISTATTHTTTVWLYPGTRTWAFIQFFDGTDRSAYFNLSGAGAVGTTTGIVSASITLEATGYYRCDLVATSGSTSTLVCIGLANGNGGRSYSGDGTSGFYVWLSNCSVGSFGVPPILTQATVNGNQQVISGLGTQLAVGVAGILQFKPFSDTSNDRFLRVYVDANNSFMLRNGTGRVRLTVTSGGVEQADVIDTGTVSAYVNVTKTLAFAVGSNYFNFRVVGETQPTVDTSGTYPTGLTTLAIGGLGSATTQNAYQFTTKLALKFGPQDASTFAAMYAKAVLAAAA